jgi:hypothetical protein
MKKSAASTARKDLSLPEEKYMRFAIKEALAGIKRGREGRLVPAS